MSHISPAAKALAAVMARADAEHERRQSQTRDRGFWCVKPLTTSDLPGYRGYGPQKFEAGKTWICADHEAARHFPDHFARDGSAKADAARSAARTRSRAAKDRPQPSRQAPRPAAPAREPAFALRSRGGALHSAPQTRRPRAVTGGDIWDLSTVRGSVADPDIAARELRDRAMRAVERFRFPHGAADADGVRGHLVKLIDGVEDRRGAFCARLLTTGSPAYRDLFSRAARGLGLSADEKRAMSLDGADGGFALPITLDPTIIPTSNGVVNPLRAISRVESTLTDKWKGVTGEGPAARYRPQGTEAEEGEVKLAQPELKMEGADWWEASAYELDQDWSGLEPQLASMLQRAKDELEAVAFLTGDGDGEPFGLLTGATETVETATKEVFAAGDLEAVEEALPPGFLGGAQWLGNRSIFKRVRGFTVEGAPAWVKVPGVVPEINGLPARELSSMAATVEGGDKILVVGDFRYFLIADRLGMSIRFVEQFGKDRRPTGEMGIFAMWRNGSKVLSADAFRVLRVKN